MSMFRWKKPTWCFWCESSNVFSCPPLELFCGISPRALCRPPQSYNPTWDCQSTGHALPSVWRCASPLSPRRRQHRHMLPSTVWNRCNIIMMIYHETDINYSHEIVRFQLVHFTHYIKNTDYVTFGNKS